jgi:parvulin-like peptidyl-prolyl isomerase
MSDEYDGTEDLETTEDLDSAADPTTTGPDSPGAGPIRRPVRRPRPAPGAGYGSSRYARREPTSGLTLLVVPIFAGVALLALIAAVAFDHFHNTAAATPTAVPTTPPAATAVPTATFVVPPTAVSSKPGLAAEVNGVGVSLKEFNQEVASTAASIQAQTPGTDITKGAGLKTYNQQVSQAFQSLIDTAYAVSYAKKHNLVATKKQIAALLAQYQSQAGGAAAFTQQTQAAGFTQDVVNQIISDAATEQNVQAAVTKNVPCGTKGTPVCDVHMRIILLKSTQQTLANTLSKELKADKGSNFAALAKKNSTDTTSAALGGDAGYYTKGQISTDFDKAIFSLKDMGISSPISTTYGLFIVQALGTRPPSSVTQPFYTKWLATQEKTATIDKYVKIPKA